MIQAYASPEVQLPAWSLDGLRPRTYEPVDVPEQKDVDAYLPSYKPELILDPDKPMAFGSLALPKEYFRLRRRIDYDMTQALSEVVSAGADFKKRFGRSYGLFEEYQCQDATTILVTAGAISMTAQEAVDSLRREGHRAGALRLRVFRPFPTAALRASLPEGARLAVVDRSYSPGATGIFFQEIKAALYPLPARSPATWPDWVAAISP